MAENNRHLLAPSAAIIKTDNFSASRSPTLASSYGRTGPIRPRSPSPYSSEKHLKREACRDARRPWDEPAGTKQRSERSFAPAPSTRTTTRTACCLADPAEAFLNWTLHPGAHLLACVRVCARAHARGEQTLHLSIRLGRVQPEFMSYRYGGSTSSSPLCGSRPAERGAN